MRYAYSIVYPPREDGSYILRPIVDVRISGPAGERYIHAIIDSGADISIAHGEYAEKLGIKKQRSVEIVGVNRQALRGFIGEMMLDIGGIQGAIATPFVFVDNPAEHIILGQQVFFDLHRILFERHKRTFEITRIRNKRY